jgi:hypothetical protein
MYKIRFVGGSLDGIEWNWPVDDIPAVLSFTMLRGLRELEPPPNEIRGSIVFPEDDPPRQETYVNSTGPKTPSDNVLIFEPSPPAIHWIPEQRR